jgi:zinc protease
MHLKSVVVAGLIGLLGILIAAPIAAADDAATQPAGGGELLAPAQGHFGDESYRIIDEPGEIVSVLRNGATVIAKRVASPVVAVRGYVWAGSVYEQKWIGGGLSHLLEHLCAGGSNDRRTEEQNKRLLQKIGNDSNAYTDADHTAYFINTTGPHLDDAVDLVTGWMLGASITVPEYRREYQVVQRELEMGKGQPARVFYYLTQFNRYRVSPAHDPIIGYQEVIQGLTRDDVYSYYKMAYVPNNMIFSVSGDADPETMLASVQKHVSDAKPGRAFSHDIAPEPAVVSPRLIVATFPKLGQARLNLAFPSVRLQHPDLYALDLLATILGSGESSILVQDLRDTQQLVTDIGCDDMTPSYVDGSFEIQMELDADKIEPARKAVLAELEKVKTQGIDDARLKRAQTVMRSDRLRGLQTAQDIASSLALDFLTTGDVHFSDRYVDRIAAVTSAQIQDVARRYFDESKLLTTAMIPAEAVGASGLPKAEEIVRSAMGGPAGAAAAAATQSPHVTRVELDNGAILLLKRITTTPLVSVNVYSLGGLTAEDASTNGLGHLTMSMLSRGTATHSAPEIAEFFDSIGGSMSTGCGNNSWFWQGEFLKADFDNSMEMFGDIFNNPAFADAEVAPIKQRTVAAIRSQDAEWTDQAFRFFRTSFYGPMNSPYQFMPVGTEKNVLSFAPADMKKWYTDKVLTGRRVIAIYGDVDPEQATAAARKYLGAGPKLAPLTPPQFSEAPAAPPAVTPHMNVTDVKVQKTEQDLAGVVIGFKSNSLIGEPASETFDVADTLCSGYSYPTGYIFETLRGLGLVYVADAENSPGRSKQFPGTFMAYAGCDPKNVNQVVDLILLNIARMQGSDADMQLDWYTRSKELIVTSDALDHETPQSQAATAALDELFGLGYAFHDGFAGKIDQVTLAQVRALCASRLSQCVVTVSTPQPDLVKVATGDRTYKSFPVVDLTPRGIQFDTGQQK